nr:MobH family relaxase [uncultured Halomonas sp.]
MELGRFFKQLTSKQGWREKLKRAGEVELIDSITSADIPRYPPFAEGLPAANPDLLMETQAELILEIKLAFGLPPDKFKKLVLPMIRRYAGYVHLLPASESHHHRGAGGLFRHSLEVALFAMRRSEAVIFSRRMMPSENKRMEPRWRMASFLGGLIHDAGKPISDMRVSDLDGTVYWNPFSDPTLFEWAQNNGLERYYLSWAKQRHGRHELHTPHAIHALVHDDLRGYLAVDGSGVMDALMEALTGLSVTTPLSRVIINADSNSVNADMRERYIGHVDENAVGVAAERYIVSAMRSLISNGQWKVNEAGAHVWVSSQGIFINWRQAAKSISEQLDKEKARGVPRSPEVMAEILIERDLAEPRRVVSEDDNGKTSIEHLPLWHIAVEVEGAMSAASVEMMALKVEPDILFASTPPPAAMDGLSVIATEAGNNSHPEAEADSGDDTATDTPIPDDEAPESTEADESSPDDEAETEHSASPDTTTDAGKPNFFSSLLGELDGDDWLPGGLATTPEAKSDTTTDQPSTESTESASREDAENADAVEAGNEVEADERDDNESEKSDQSATKDRRAPPPSVTSAPEIESASVVVTPGVAKPSFFDAEGSNAVDQGESLTKRHSPLWEESESATGAERAAARNKSPLASPLSEMDTDIDGATRKRKPRSPTLKQRAQKQAQKQAREALRERIVAALKQSVMANDALAVSVDVAGTNATVTFAPLAQALGLEVGVLREKMAMMNMIHADAKQGETCTLTGKTASLLVREAKAQAKPSHDDEKASPLYQAPLRTKKPASPFSASDTSTKTPAPAPAPAAPCASDQDGKDDSHDDDSGIDVREEAIKTEVDAIKCLIGMMRAGSGRWLTSPVKRDGETVSVDDGVLDNIRREYPQMSSNRLRVVIRKRGKKLGIEQPLGGKRLYVTPPETEKKAG